MTNVRTFSVTILLFCAAVGAGLSGCDTTETCVPRDGTVVTEDVTVGPGLAVASVDDSVFVYYLGELENGNIFSSYVRSDGEPLGLLVSGLIEGWKIGLVGMREGGRRKLTIPPTLAYGCRDDTNGIPPNSTLKFDITLERVVRP